MTTFRVQQGRLEAQGATAEDRGHLVALRDLWEERAGILEYEAGFSREEAEARALAELMPSVAKGAA